MFAPGVALSPVLCGDWRVLGIEYLLEASSIILPILIRKYIGQVNFLFPYLAPIHTIGQYHLVLHQHHRHTVWTV